MKKIIALSLVSLFVFSCCAQASSYSNYKKDIRNNERKINQIKSSKTLSNHYKSREIRRLERQNYYLKKMR